MKQKTENQISITAHTAWWAKFGHCERRKPLIDHNLSQIYSSSELCKVNLKELYIDRGITIERN